MQSEIANFSKDRLKPTTTIVYKIPVVPNRATEEHNITGVITDSEIEEYFDAPEVLEEKARKLAQAIKESSHFVVYTGAGISTAANIPDYRGPKGVWTLKSKGQAVEMKITLQQAEPTFTHMALVTLYRKGYLKYIVSTNVDGLHRRSGIPEKGIAELHGNIYREVCPVCHSEYVRPFDIRGTGGLEFISKKRTTGRLCEKKNEDGELCCMAKLRDSIVDFGENLPKQTHIDAIENSKKADLTLVLGSSMRVLPACDLPSFSYKQGGKFSIVNLQKTRFDEESEKHGLRIFSKCDELMKIVLEELELTVDEWSLEDDILTKQMEGIIVDPACGNDGLSKYNVQSMSDDGPPPAAVLDQIKAGFSFRCHVEPKILNNPHI